MYEFSPLVLLICFLRPHVFLCLAEEIHSQKLSKCEHAKKNRLPHNFAHAEIKRGRPLMRQCVK